MTDVSQVRPVDERMLNALHAWRTSKHRSRNQYSDYGRMADAIAALDVYDAQHPKPVKREMAERVWHLYETGKEADLIEDMRVALEQAGITTSAREDEAKGGFIDRAMLDGITAQRDDALAKLKEAETDRNIWRDSAEETGCSLVVAAGERDEWKARAEKAEDDCTAWAKDYMERGNNLSLTLYRAQTAEIKVMDAEKVSRVLTQQLESAIAENEALKARAETAKAKLAAAQHQAPDVGAQCTDEDLIAFHMAYEECNSAEHRPAWRAGITAVLQRRQALGPAQQGEPGAIALPTIKTWTGTKITPAALVDDLRRYQNIHPTRGRLDWVMLEAAKFIEAVAAQIAAPAVEGERDDNQPDIREVGIKCSCGAIAHIGSWFRSDSADISRIECGNCSRISDEGFSSSLDDLAAKWHADTAAAAPSPDPLPVEQIAAGPDVVTAVRALVEGLEHLLEKVGNLDCQSNDDDWPSEILDDAQKAIARAKQAMGDEHARAALDKLKEGV